MSFAKQVSPKQGKQKARIAFHAHMGSFWPHLAPRNGFTKTCTREATVVFWCGGDVNSAVKTATVLIPPDNVMLGNATADHQGIGHLDVPSQITHDLLIR